MAKKFNLPANFLSYLESGSLKIKYNEKPLANLLITKDKKIIDIIEIPVKIDHPGIIQELSEARELAKDLREKKISLEIKYKGDTVLYLGEGAKPKLSKILTLSGDIEIKNILKLKKLASTF